MATILMMTLGIVLLAIGLQGAAEVHDANRPPPRRWPYWILCTAGLAVLLTALIQ